VNDFHCNGAYLFTNASSQASIDFVDEEIDFSGGEAQVDNNCTQLLATPWAGNFKGVPRQED